MTTPDPQSIHDRVLRAIAEDRVSMTPRWHFILKTTLLSLGALVLTLTLIYLSSFIFFMLNQTGISTVPEFGLRGWYAFLLSLPWLLIGLSLLFIIVLEILVQRTAFAYRRPILYTTFGIITLVILAGLLVAQTSLHRGLANSAERGELSIGNSLYQAYSEASKGDIHHGQINALNDHGFLLRGRHAEIFRVIITPRTRLPYGADFAAGDFVVVFGPSRDGTIEAYGIREVGE
jgi:hypothetical protein